MKKTAKLAACTILFAASGITSAATVDLTGKGYYTYGDANSYSLPANGLEVMSGPGQITLFTKLGLGANGQQDNGTAGMDNAYDTPNANNIAGFRMSAANEPDGVQGSWDRNGWWDSTLSALNSKLNFNQNSMVFFFANNETGGGDSDNLAAWARLELTQISSGASLGYFEFTNDANHDGISTYATPPVGSGVPLGDPTLFTSLKEDPVLADFVKSGGNFCLDAGGQPQVCDGTEAANYEHNLGGDRAAYAVVVPELDALIASLVGANANLDDYALHVEYRLGCGPEAGFDALYSGNPSRCDPNYALNGGDEKVFLGTQLLQGGNNVPEPASLLLVAAGLIAAGSVRRSIRN